MKRSGKFINKQAFKRTEGKCHFCEESNYDLLEVHRICEGRDGGRYTRKNSICLCVLHHKMIHAKMIKIFGKYFTSNGRWVVHYIDENNEERWV
jgi:hypothetical protein